MAQFQVRTGPIQNNAATISPEMMQGSMPPTNRQRLGPRIPQPLSQQMTHVAATPSVEMFSGAQGVAFPAPRITRGNPFGVSIAQTTQVDAPFSAPMTNGAQGGNIRLIPSAGKQVVMPISQTTHVAATFSPDMSAGNVPAKNRIFIPLKVNGPSTIDINPFSPESVFGYFPASPRILLGVRIGQPLSQTTHVANTFTPDMVQGSLPWRNCVFLAPRLFVPGPVSVDPFSLESVFGNLPTSPRITFGKQIGQPISQPTHVAASFSQEMAAGNIPAAPRAFIAKRFNQPIVIDVSPFSNEMVVGQYPAHPRLTRGPRLQQSTNLVYIDAFSVEMVAGWHPDNPRLILGPRINQPVSNAMHLAAPFSAEMVQGLNSIHPLDIHRNHAVNVYVVVGFASLLTPMGETSTRLLLLPYTTEAAKLPLATRSSNLPNSTEEA